MTISRESIRAIAPDVPGKAQEESGLISPFISFRSLDALCQGSETLQECLKEVAIKSLRYTETVCRFEQIVLSGQKSNEDDSRKEIETLRKAVHDSTISAINCLSRNMKLANIDNKWISKLAITRDPARDRVNYAKFAILIAFEIVRQ
jgi:hypothetical protein